MSPYFSPEGHVVALEARKLMKLSEAVVLLEREIAEVDKLFQDIPDEQWRQATVSQGWTVADQLGHLVWTDQLCLSAIDNDERFQQVVALAQGSDPEAFTKHVDAEAHRLAEQEPAELLNQWTTTHHELLTRLKEYGDDQETKIAWLARPMSPTSMAQARTMELWAHSLDIYDAVGWTKPRNEAEASVAELGVKTRDFAFTLHGHTPPQEPIYVQLSLQVGPDLSFGDPDAENRVIGSAWGFCAVVTQRRHFADADLSIEGETAKLWMQIAQAFAGAATTGPEPGERLSPADLED
ncbi:TIGR03084 family protein [Auritidibacter sp. NML130574]|nr:TIGR03084 family protein [Auritidibacter sp. NML130574]PXA81234.1 TIGR03084 family protein [Auritidibacter sp. NML120779]